MKWVQLYTVHAEADSSMTLKRLAKLMNEDYDPDVGYVETTLYEGQEKEALELAEALHKAAPGVEITVHTWQSAFSDTGVHLSKTRNRRRLKKLGAS